MKVVKVEKVIEFKENFPIDGEAYIVGKGENGKYFFAWGPEIPYDEEVPAENVPDGDSGIEWYETEKEATSEMEEVMEAWEN